MRWYHIVILGMAAGAGTLYYNRYNAVVNMFGPATPQEDLETQAIYQLIQAAAEGDIATTQALLAQSVDPNARNSERKTALMYASWNGHNAICQMLLSAGAVTDLQDRHGLNAYDYAASRGLDQTVQLLLRLANQTDTHHYLEFAHIMRATYGRDPRLLPEGATLPSVNRITTQGRSPLHLAASQGDIAMAEALIARGAKVNLRNDTHQTPLHWAAWSNQAAMVEMLLAQGANIHAVDDAGDSALHLAVRSESAPTISLLLSKGANKELMNKSHVSPEILAQSSRNPELAPLMQ